MAFVERCDHNRFAAQLVQRISQPVIVPAADRAVTITHNYPVEPVAETVTAEEIVPVLDQARAVFDELGVFLQDAPVIQDEATAKRGAAFLERARLALQEARDERTRRTQPLMDRLTAIRNAFDLVRDKTKTNEGGPLERAYNALRKRLTDYAAKVEAARIAEAERLMREAQAAEAAARAAEAAEQEAIADAEVGVVTDVAAAIDVADQTFADFKRADRLATRAAREVPVRFGSVTGGRAQTMRTIEVLTVSDVALAIKAMGLTPKITEALLSSARDYRKAYGELPPGIAASHERSL
ncbi:hypothetical protein ACRAVF_27010 [Bradyrhizobium oligotrophicum S58]